MSILCSVVPEQKKKGIAAYNLNSTHLEYYFRSSPLRGSPFGESMVMSITHGDVSLSCSRFQSRNGLPSVHRNVRLHVKCRIEYHAEKSTTHKLCYYARARGKCQQDIPGLKRLGVEFNFMIEKCCSAIHVHLNS